MGKSVKNSVSGQVFPFGPRQMPARRAARMIAVTGGSIGVGRTAVVVNLAIALTRQGIDVLVVDECPGDQSAGNMLGALRDGGAFAHVKRGKFPRVLASDRDLPEFITMGACVSTADDFDGLAFDSLAVNGPDVVLIDAALDGSGSLSPLASQAKEVVIVMQLSSDAVADAYICMKRLRVAQDIVDFRVIVNRVADEAGVDPVLDSLRDLARDYLAASVVKAGCIAADPCITRAVELSHCLADAFPASPAAGEFARLAAEMQSRRPLTSWRRAAKLRIDSRPSMRALGPAPIRSV